MSCSNTAVLKCIPHKVLGSDYSEYAIPGWNERVKDKHNVARDAFLDWLYAGKPNASRIGLHNMTKITRTFQIGFETLQTAYRYDLC